MKVFISWSGELSKRVAELLKNWVKCVLQATEPWISTEDIAKGSLWFNEINDQLKDTTIGIICLTPDNLSSPWILFEAGALAKGLQKSRVCTLLINVKPSDLRDPLARFNATSPVRSEMFKLIETINEELKDKGLGEGILKQTFEHWWEQFEDKFQQTLKDYKPLAKPDEKDPVELMEEILKVCRQNQAGLENLRTDIAVNSAIETEEEKFLRLFGGPNSNSNAGRDWNRLLAKVASATKHRAGAADGPQSNENPPHP